MDRWPNHFNLGLDLAFYEIIEETYNWHRTGVALFFAFDLRGEGREVSERCI